MYICTLLINFVQYFNIITISQPNKMNKKLAGIAFLAFILTLAFNSCSGNSKGKGSDSTDSIIAEAQKPKDPQPGDSTFHFKDTNEILHYLDTTKDAAKYKGGIIPVIAREVPDYADKLIYELHKYDRFIVVDKASMRVILYDKYGQVMKSYGMACAKNYGTKHKKADSRTPEGFFSLEGKYDSTNWYFTNDWGYTSKVRGVFGPRFLRLKTPVTRQIGIHGTGSPGSIGKRVSHGCIRITNENILELHGLVEPGIPIIVLPGPKDREVNRKEGYNIAYFPTGQEFAMTEEEKSKPVNPEQKDFTQEEAKKGTSKTPTKAESDSIASAPSIKESKKALEKEPETKPESKHEAVRDSI